MVSFESLSPALQSWPSHGTVCILVQRLSSQSAMAIMAAHLVSSSSGE